MKLSQHQSKFTHDIGKLILYAFEVGIQLTHGEGTRSIDQQRLYYYGKKIDKYGRLVEGKKKTKNLNSNHLKRLAQDFNFFIVQADGTRKLTYKQSDVQILGDYWISLDPEHNVWGGNWGWDSPHFERRI